MARDARDVVLDELVDELARVYWEDGRAQILVQRGGFPTQDLPRFTTPREFWTSVFRTVADGEIAKGMDVLQTVSSAAVEEYPSNEVFRHWKELDLERLAAALRELAPTRPRTRPHPWSLMEIRRRWPEVFDVGSPLEIIGEFDREGRLLDHPDSLADAAAFLDAHPDGLCFVHPHALARLHAEGEEADEGVHSQLHRHRERLLGLTSLSILLARLGVETDEEPLTALFAAARRGCERFTDWSGRSCRIDELSDLPLEEQSNEGRRSFSVRLPHLIREPRWRASAKPTAQPSIVVEGRAGSGKSVLLRQLHHRLSVGEDRYRGPSLRLDARRTRGTETFGDAVARAHRAPHLAELADTLVRLPHVASSVWLLVDGLDEVAPEERRRLLELVHAWPGPRVLTSRALPEPLSGTIRAHIPPLRRHEAQAMFVALGGSNARFEALVGPPGPGYWPPPKDTPSPMRATMQLIAETALGVATLVRANDDELTLRQGFLHRNILRQVERAEAEGRIDRTLGRWFNRQGLRAFGAVTWRMLERGQGTIRADDIDWAAEVLRLEQSAVEHLHRAIEELGITTPVGPGEWELNHKSMAEYCAAWASSSGVVDWQALLSRLSESAASEVLLHLASFATHARAVVEALLEHPTLPLTGLALATRALREAPRGLVEMPTIVELLRRQLRIATWLPDDELPGGVGDMADVTAIITAYQAELRGYHAALLEACHPELTAWLEGRRPPGGSELHHRTPVPANREEARHRRAETLALALGLELPLRAWLLMPNGVEILRARGRGEWARELAELLDDEDPWICGGARSVWAHCLPRHELLDHLPLLSTSFPHRDRILEAVLHAGSALQQREALLRAASADVRFSDGRYGDDETHYALRDRLDDIGSEQWLARWSWAWTVGLLGHATHSDPLERLYAGLVQDDEGPARWRALVAMSNLHRGASSEHHRKQRDAAGLAALRAELERRALLALDDPFAAVRIEAMGICKGLGVAPPLEQLLASLMATDDDERTIAWSLVLRDEASCTVERLLAILPRWHARHLAGAKKPPDLGPSPHFVDIRSKEPLTCWQHAVQRHGAEARRELQSRFGKASTAEDVRLLIHLLGDPRYHATAEALLMGADVRPHRDLLIRILEGEPSPRRRWAAQRLHWLDLPRTMLEALRRDGDEEVARAAHSCHKWIEYEEQLHDAPGVPAVAVIPDEAPAWATGYSIDDGPGPRLPVFDLRELGSFRDFRALMDVLGERSIPWKSATTMEGFSSRDGDGFLDHLASQARSENVEIIEAVVKALVRLLDSEHVPQLVADLDHPLRGFWAAQVLARQPKQRPLLEAFTTSLRAATRAAMAAARTPLAASAADAFIAALSSGKLAVPTDPEAPTTVGPWGSLPRWLTALASLAGTEGLLRLLVSSPPPGVAKPLLDHLSRPQRLGRGPIAASVRSTVAEWARAIVHRPDAEERLRLLALRLLGRTGTEEDGRSLRAWLDSTTVSPSSGAAALDAIGELSAAEHLDLFLGVVERTEDMAPLEAALGAIGAHCDASLVDRLLEWLATPPRAVRLAMDRNDRRDRLVRTRISRRRRPRERIQDEEAVPLELGTLAREYIDGWQRAPALGVARVGSRAQVLRLAELVRDHSWAIGLAERYGHHPEHALLVLGALAHDPGDSVVPASVTGGGDEVYGSDVPERARGVIRCIVERTNREDVRVAFLEAALWGTSYDAQRLFDEHGGPRPIDAPRILQHLERSPDDALALQYLAETKRGEHELRTLWSRLGVPWWPV